MPKSFTLITIAAIILVTAFLTGGCNTKDKYGEIDATKSLVSLSVKNKAVFDLYGNYCKIIHIYDKSCTVENPLGHRMYVGLGGEIPGVGEYWVLYIKSGRIKLLQKTTKLRWQHHLIHWRHLIEQNKEYPRTKYDDRKPIIQPLPARKLILKKPK